MGFDVKEMTPSYRFYQGVPGQSMAIEIFERIANENPYGVLIGEEARSLIDKKQVNYEKLVQQVATKNKELDELLQSNRHKERDLMNREKSLDGLMKIKISDELAKAIAAKQSGFGIKYAPDFRQAIADSWPNSIDDQDARNDWGWKIEYDLTKMVEVMLHNVDPSKLD
jgi:hypothetical protein